MRFYVKIAISVLLLLEIKEAISGEAVLQKNFYDRDAEPVQEQRMKKPFCNAFTGCGRKRADMSVVPTMYDMNSESAIDELTRRILTRAKVLEALEEARNAVLRNRLEDPMDAQEMQNPFLNYIRRKRCAAGSNHC